MLPFRMKPAVGGPVTPVELRQRFRVSTGCLSGLVKLIGVQFYQDGLFVHFPYQPEANGLMSLCVFPAGTSRRTFDLRERASTTAHKVKYSHKIDGNAHFSQDSKIKTTIRASSRPLTTTVNHLFSLDVQGLREFEPLSTDEYHDGRRYGKAHFDLLRDDYPDALHVAGHWLRADRGYDIDTLHNPVTVEFPNGEVRAGCALGPPPGSAMSGGRVGNHDDTEGQVLGRGSLRRVVQLRLQPNVAGPVG